MNTMTTNSSPPPSCFGLDWDRNEPECAGGPHPTRRNPKNGSHVLDRCDFFVSCGARTAALKNASGNLIPPQQLVRPPTTTPPPAPKPVTPPAPQQPTPQSQTFAQWLQSQTGTTAQHPGTPTVTVPTPRPVQPPQYIPGGSVQPATTWQLNYSMPSFLSMPEVRQPGESIWGVLFREILRAMAKGAGHAIAHFFDTRPFQDK